MYNGLKSKEKMIGFRNLIVSKEEMKKQSRGRAGRLKVIDSTKGPCIAIIEKV
jgi:hypothetical protein